MMELIYLFLKIAIDATDVKRAETTLKQFQDLRASETKLELHCFDSVLFQFHRPTIRVASLRPA